MKVALYEGIKQISIREWDLPKLKENEILIKVKASGICATDVKTYLRGHPAFTPPLVLGHEYSGIVEDIGSNITICDRGDRVTVAPYIECGKCVYCLKGDGELCADKFFAANGAFAEYVVLNEEFAKRAIIILSSSVDFEAASLTEPVACCLNAVNQCGIKEGDNVMVIGAGTMGIINGLMCKIRGAKNVIVSDMNEKRLAIAGELGLIPLNVEKEDSAAAIDKLTDGIKCDAVIVAVGNTEAVEEGFKFARKGGKVHMFGGTPKGSKLQVEPYLIHYSKVTLLGSSGFSQANFKEAGKVINRYGNFLAKIITHRYSLDEIEAAINHVAEGIGLKTIITFE